MSGAYKNQCQSVFVAAMPWNPREVADHQCSGPVKCDGKHYCGCGYDWDDAIAAISQKPARERTAEENAVIDRIVQKAT